MKYKVIRQSPVDERMFTLERQDGVWFMVDIFTNGGLNPPREYYDERDANKAGEIFGNWLKSFVGKTLDIEGICPLHYVTEGMIKVQ